VERVWFDLAREFAARGHEVSIAARAYPGLPVEEVREGVRVFRRFSYARTGSLKWDLVKDLAYSAQSAAVLSRGDILVTNAFWMPAMAGVARRSAGRLVVNLNRFPKGQLWLYAAAARFTAVSRAVRDAAVEHYPRAARITHVLPNPIDRGVFSPPALPRAYGDSPVVLFTGRVHPEKGLDLLVRAYAELRRVVPVVRLRLVGPVEVERGGGGEAYVRELREMAGGAPIEVPGPVDDRAALCRELREAHVYCYPSRASAGRRCRWRRWRRWRRGWFRSCRIWRCFGITLSRV
jgi:glycosyltransferase involved in cell wall biosynthesis